MNTDIVKKEVLTVQQEVNSLVVANPEQALAASELLHRIKDATKFVTSKKEEITAPLMASLGSIKALFKPFEQDLADADKRVRAKVIAYEVDKEEKKAKELAKIEDRAEKGLIRHDTATKKIGELKDVPRTEGLRVQTRRVLDVTDESMLPREFLVPDRVAITKALFAGHVVPGACLKDEKILNVV